MRSKISHCRLHENSVIKLLNENDGVSLQDEFTHHKTVSQKDAFLFL